MNGVRGAAVRAVGTVGMVGECTPKNYFTGGDFMTQIQQPTIGRIVEVHAHHGGTVPGIITGVYNNGRIDIQLFGDHSYTAWNIPFCQDLRPGTWRYPPRCDEMIEVEE